MPTAPVKNAVGFLIVFESYFEPSNFLIRL